MPHNDVPTLKVWKAATDVSGGRGTLLKALDTAIDNFNTAPAHEKDAKRVLVAQAWTAWRGKGRDNAEIRSAKRNGSKALSLLERVLIDYNLIPDPYTVGLNLSRVPIKFVDDNKREVEIDDLKLPGVNLSGQLISDAIDKGFAEALVALNEIVGLLDANSSDAQTMVKLWFGKTPVADVAQQFKTLRDHVTETRRSLREPIQVQLRLGEAIAGVSEDVTWRHIQFHPSYFETGRLAGANTYMFKRLTSKVATTEYVRKWGQYDTARKGLDRKIDILKKSGRDGNNKEAIKKLESELDSLKRDRIAEIKILESDFLTRYGVVIHELSHLVLDTDDVEIDIPSLTIDGIKVKGSCYGATVCSELAAYDSTLALKNADNYRLFAETCRF